MPDAFRDALQALLGPGFELSRELSGGGMSRVFVAHEPALKRDVVVKVLPSDLFTRKSADRFQREVDVTVQLQHPHILPVVTAGGNDRIRFYVVPFIAGGSLRERLASGERLSLDAGLAVVRELLTAVAFAHERGILHRDIKPGNVLLAEGHAVLADFGIAQALAAAQAEDAQTSTSVAPPAAYMAPERPTDATADVYAVAVLTYELLTGRLPETGPGVEDTVVALRARHPAAPRDRVRALATVLSRALSVTPTRRYGSATALRTALQHAGQPRRMPLVMVSALSGVAAMALTAVLALGRPAPAPSDRPSMDRAARPLSPPTSGSASLQTGREAVVATLPSSAALASTDPTPQQRAREHLRVATEQAWRSGPAEHEHATRAALEALANRSWLSSHEILLAEGIVALGRRRYPEACAAFDEAREARESFAAWMGSAECRARDSLAVVDASGAPAFRGSWYAAATAYREAGRVGSPPEMAAAYSRLPHVLVTDAARVRRGFTADGRVILGQPVASGDSIAFEAFAPGPRRRTAESVAASARATAMAREMLRPALVRWVAADSSSVRARELLADLLEATGNVRDAGPDGVTALDLIRQARRLPAIREVELRLARSEVRLLLRSGDFAGAAQLADAVLARYPQGDNAESEILLSLAMLTGKATRATALLEQVSGGPGRQLQLGEGRVLDVPATAHRARAEFMVASTLGLCTETMRTAPARLAAIVDAMFPDGERPRGVDGAFLERPLLLAIPCVGLTAIRALREPTHPVARALHVPSEDALDRAIGVVEAMQRARMQAGGSGFDATESALTAAHLYLLRGDTAAASATLARSLDGLVVMPNVFLHSEMLAGSLPRAMALRAELAAARGDAEAARRWGSGATALWAQADDALQPVVRRVRTVAGVDVVR